MASPALLSLPLRPRKSSPPNPMEVRQPHPPPPRASLLGIPPELRLLIFAHVLPASTCMLHFSHNRFTRVHTSGTSTYQTQQSNLPGILQANRLLREESIPVYYGGMRVELYIFDGDTWSLITMLQNWMAGMDPRARDVLFQEDDGEGFGREKKERVVVYEPYFRPLNQRGELVEGLRACPGAVLKRIFLRS